MAKLPEINGSLPLWAEMQARIARLAFSLGLPVTLMAFHNSGLLEIEVKEGVAKWELFKQFAHAAHQKFGICRFAFKEGLTLREFTFEIRS